MSSVEQRFRQILREELTAAVELLAERIASPRPPEPPHTTWLTDVQVSEHTGISVNTLRGWRLRSEGLPFMKIGTLVRYDLDEVDRAIRSMRHDVGRE